MATVGEDEWSFVAALSSEIKDALSEHGCNDESSYRIAETVVLQMQKKHGGEKYYLSSVCKKKRNQLIVSDWKSGMDKPDIANKHDIHISTVNRIISKHLQNKTPKSHGFGSDEWLL